MAFSSSFKPLHHQNHLRSFNLCKSPSSLSSNYNNFSHGFSILSPNKPSKPPPFLQFQAQITTHSDPIPVTEQEHSKPTISRRILDKIEHGFSSFKSKDQRLEKKFQKPVENDNRVAKNRKNDGSGSSSLRSKDEKIAKNTSKRSKKGKLDSPGAVLRLGLEICSKQGDIMGAIGVYDLAKREGIELGQYHYAVILYLCSSAATGVVHPAKSGRSISTSSKPELSNYNSENFKSLSENGDQIKNHASLEPVFQTLDGLIRLINDHDEGLNVRNGIRVDENVKDYAIEKGFEIYEEMVSEKVSINEAILTSLARMAMARNDGQKAFDFVKQMKDLGINPRLRSYDPALSVFCNNGNVEKAFEVEEHMLAHGVYPEEPELNALLIVSIECCRSDKVYYLLHKLRTSVRKVSNSTANVIEKWFKSKTASRIGKRKWDFRLINKAFENGGGGWHGEGWLGRGKWNITRSFVGKDGLCKFCCEKLAIIDLDPKETENFAESVARIAKEREKDSRFEKFEKWLDYYGPFEAVIDGANVGLFSQRRFKPSKINTISNGIRQRLPSKKCPLIILHNKRLTGDKMDEGLNKTLVEKWKNADALYATPTGSNDDWYWLYAAIKFKCLLVTNDEMRDHLFQLLGNDFFPKWKERHQVRFHFSETGPVYHMPPPCSVVIQESVKGHWHIPIASEQDLEEERVWLCVTRDNSSKSMNLTEELGRNGLSRSEVELKTPLLKNGSHGRYEEGAEEHYGSLKETLLKSFSVNQDSILTQIIPAEKLGGCVLDFQI